MNVSVNSLAKDLRAITRIAKAAILQDLCPESMGVSVKKKHLHTGRTAKFAQWCLLLVLPAFCTAAYGSIGVSVKNHFHNKERYDRYNEINSDVFFDASIYPGCISIYERNISC